MNSVRGRSEFPAVLYGMAPEPVRRFGPKVMDSPKLVGNFCKLSMLWTSSARLNERPARRKASMRISHDAVVRAQITSSFNFG